MRKANILFAAIIAGVLTTPFPAWAGCASGDLFGLYQIYASSVDTGEYGWSRCDLIVRSNGTIKSGTTCVDLDGGTDTITGGTLFINKTCRVTGTITTTDGTSVIDHARFDLARAILVGVGHDVVGGDSFTFTALRR